MDLKQLRYFKRIVEAGSFSRAAETLGLSQPALSRQIRMLEEEVGSDILVRTGRGTALTSAGAHLLAHAEEIIRHMDTAQAEISELRRVPEGPVTLGVTPTTGVLVPPSFIHDFKDEFPNTRLTIVEGMSGHIYEWMLRGIVDIAVLHQPVNNSNIVNEKLALEDIFLVCAPEIATLPAVVAFRELSAFPLILTTSNHALRKQVDELVARMKLTLTIAYELDSVSAIQELIKSGAGYGLLPAGTVAGPICRGMLSVAKIVEPQLTRTLTISFAPHTKMTPVIREVRTRLREIIQGQLVPFQLPRICEASS